MRLVGVGIATPVWGSLLDNPEGWVAPWKPIVRTPTGYKNKKTRDAEEMALIAQLSELVEATR